MRLYAESSAVVAWLLDETSAGPIVAALSKAEVVVSSELTVLETERVLVRAEALDLLTLGEVATSRERLLRAAEHWMVMGIGVEIITRAAHRFPVEPVRTLDALHLASALEARTAVPDLAVLSLDDRIRNNATALGLDVVPSA